MWTRTSRSGDAFPVPHGAAHAQVVCVREETLGEGDLVSPCPPGLGDHLGIGHRAVPVGIGDIVGPVKRGASSPAITRRNQFRSTSAICRIRPSRDIVDGGTDRRASWLGVEVRALHLHGQPVTTQVIEQVGPLAVGFRVGKPRIAVRVRPQVGVLRRRAPAGGKSGKSLGRVGKSGKSGTAGTVSSALSSGMPSSLSRRPGPSPEFPRPLRPAHARTRYRRH